MYDALRRRHPIRRTRPLRRTACGSEKAADTAGSGHHRRVGGRENKLAVNRRNRPDRRSNGLMAAAAKPQGPDSEHTQHSRRRLFPYSVRFDSQRHKPHLPCASLNSCHFRSLCQSRQLRPMSRMATSSRRVYDADASERDVHRETPETATNSGSITSPRWRRSSVVKYRCKSAVFSSLDLLCRVCPGSLISP